MTDEVLPTPRPASGSSRKGIPRGWRLIVLLALLVSGAAVIIYMWYQGSHVDARSHSPDELRNGPRSQIIKWDADHTAVQISHLSNYPANHLWRVVKDQGRFSEFMPFVNSTTVEEKSPEAMAVKQVLDLPFGRENLELAVTLSETSETRSATWRQVQGSLLFNQGAWIVEDHAGQAVLRYQVAGSLRWWPQWIVNYAMRQRLSSLLDAIEQRVTSLSASEPQYFAQAPSTLSGQSRK